MDKYEDALSKELTKLSDKAKLLFAALTCEHLYPNYIHFSNETKWGNPENLRNAIDTIFIHLIDDILFDEEQIRIFRDSVDLVTPDTEDFPEVMTSFALNACTAILGTLDFIIEPKPESIIEVAGYARDTVDMFILVRDDFDSNDSNVEIRVEKDPLMIREKHRQFNLIKKLSILDLSNITDSLITSLRSDSDIIDGFSEQIKSQ